MGNIKIHFTPELGASLKDFRNQYKVLAKDIATSIGKSAAYVSKLEKGEILQMDKSEFIRIVNFITNSNEGYDKFFEYVSDLVDEEELEESALFLNFDWVERHLPIPSELITYINDKIKKININIEQLIEYINKNDDIEDTFFEEYKIDRATVESNIWYPYHELDSNRVKRNFIWICLEKEYIEEILESKIKKSNYITIYVILYHIYKLEELKKYPILDDKTRNACKKKTEEKLHGHKFYTLAYRRRRLYEAENQIEVEGILSKFDYENRELTTQLIKDLSVLSDFDVDYTNEKLKGIISNLEKTDISFAVAYMAVSLEKLNKLPNGTKRDFLKAINELIDKFSNTDKEEEVFEKF
ncbi:MAG: hypothetical protein IJA07_00765 [Agathobacter sp.]|nr:hypothetical protein [Agathobacter sp.]